MPDISIDFVQARGLASIYIAQFAIFTVLAYLARGGDALNWNRELVRSARVNWAFLAFNALIAPVAFLLVGGAKDLYGAIGIPSIPESFWLGAGTALVPALAAVLLTDFIDYWSHRIRHHQWLWPMHSVHHSDTTLQYMSWYRAHFIELIFAQVVYVVLASWLGASAGAVAGIVVLRALHQQYVHMDIDWTHGRLGWLIASPRFHRWHHADHAAAYDKNFANIMPLWDRLFGTYYCPGPCREKMGFPGNPGDNFMKLMVYPFVLWGRMVRDAGRKPILEDGDQAAS